VKTIHPGKYRPAAAVNLAQRRWPQNTITQPPIWCSVDLRDGNQALIEPMSVEQKLAFFSLLVQMGFKYIEVAYPAASQTDFDFVRRLIEQDHIPQDVTIQVLVAARADLIDRTFEALRGARSAIVHMYISTSPAQREVVFGKSKEAISAMAVAATEHIGRLARAHRDGVIGFEFSPESFSATEPEYALSISEQVIERWNSFSEQTPIVNLPATVESAMPTVYADQVEWFCTNLAKRSSAIVSVHTHNDRGCAVAAAEMALLAGAQRVEGTLFGNGERTGNADLITMGLNMVSQGIDPGIDFGDLDHIAEVYRQTTAMPIAPRHPYAGELVYTAFSGSHQDAISKGLKAYRAQSRPCWDVPYLPIDPADVGRSYEAIIRINSQSGKGGISHIMEQQHGLQLPTAMKAEFSGIVQTLSDKRGTELDGAALWQCFEQQYLSATTPLQLLDFSTERATQSGESVVSIQLMVAGEPRTCQGSGNGVLDATSRALQTVVGPFSLTSYDEHALGEGSDAKAICYIQVHQPGAKAFFGAGTHSDITIASVHALFSALNRALCAVDEPAATVKG
jgi:2-isopropylmalate synthase